MTGFPDIYFGPVRPEPSWSWVGGDIADFLAHEVKVRYFDCADDLPDGALAIWIKAPGTDAVAEQIARKRITLLFFPVDSFLDETHIRRHEGFIRTARLVCLHARSLHPYFEHSEVFFVDHYNKYGVHRQDRRPGKTNLWIGAFQYVPYVLDALLQTSPRPADVVLLTNLECSRARAAAQRNAERIGLTNLTTHLERGMLRVEPWSESRQRKALLSCRAAFDVKFLGDFNQRHKPPTKLHKYLCSSIPCAINPGVPFLNQLDEPVGRLDQLHDDAFIDTVRHSDALSERLSLRSTAQRYLQLASYAVGLTDKNATVGEYLGAAI